MASREPAYEAPPLNLLLASVPNLPRALLSRLTARMIDRMDKLDGDPDVNEVSHSPPPSPLPIIIDGPYCYR